jgi:F1F0 ATPase subunit 2
MLVRLEVDEERMSVPSFDILPAWAELPSLATYLSAGFILGIVYFRSLWWSVCRFTGRGSLVATIALMIGRLVLIGGVLTLASLEGALQLLTIALGVLIARFAIMNRVWKAAP